MTGVSVPTRVGIDRLSVQRETKVHSLNSHHAENDLCAASHDHNTLRACLGKIEKVLCLSLRQGSLARLTEMKPNRNISFRQSFLSSDACKMLELVKVSIRIDRHLFNL